MSLRDRIRACAAFTPERYQPFRVDGRAVGQVAHGVAAHLATFSDVFIANEKALSLHPRLVTPDTRTRAVEEILLQLRDDGRIKGWRNEHYPVSESFYAPPLLTIERAAVPLLGTMGYGVHLNGVVVKDGRMHMWVGKRSMQKPTGPGKLDQVVAGGLPVGVSVRDNLIKECAEEAGMSAELAERAVPVGTISYLTERPEGVRHDVLFNYDIVLPEDFVPVPTDGEVDAFYLWPIEDVLNRIRDGDYFKFNAALVIIDFAVRHGVLTPDDPAYIDVTEALRLGRAGAYPVR
jgi:hypothetical protein